MKTETCGLLGIIVALGIGLVLGLVISSLIWPIESRNVEYSCQICPEEKVCPDPMLNSDDLTNECLRLLDNAETLRGATR